MSRFISSFREYTSVISADYLSPQQALVKSFKWDTKMFMKTFSKCIIHLHLYLNFYDVRLTVKLHNKV